MSCLVKPNLRISLVNTIVSDLLLQAKSGTGKTCVFSVISLESVNVSLEKIQVLVLCPSREIAYQSKYVIKAIGMYKDGMLCYGY